MISIDGRDYGLWNGILWSPIPFHWGHQGNENRARTGRIGVTAQSNTYASTAFFNRAKD